MSDIDTEVVDSLKVLDPDGRLEKSVPLIGTDWFKSPVPSPAQDCRSCCWRAVAFSAGGDGGRRPPEHSGPIRPLAQKLPIAPIFIADKVSLAVSREKDWKLRLVHAGWDNANVQQWYPIFKRQAQLGARTDIAA